MRHGLARMDQWIHPTSEWKVHRKQRKAPDSRIEVSRFFVELGAFQLQRSSGSIASLLDRPAIDDDAITACLRLLLRPLFATATQYLAVLCTTSSRSSKGGLAAKFYSLEFSHEGLILYTAPFFCQHHLSRVTIEYRVSSFDFRVASIEYRVSECVASVQIHNCDFILRDKDAHRFGIFWKEESLVLAKTLTFQLSTRFQTYP